MAHPVDIHVGQRIRQRRWLVGMTQQTLANAVGIKFQQIQKYETGANRVSASRLWEIAVALSVSLSYFFDDYGSNIEDEIGSGSGDEIMDKKTAELIRAYLSLPDNQKRTLLDLARNLSGTG